MYEKLKQIPIQIFPGTYICDDLKEEQCRKDWVRSYLETRPAHGAREPLTVTDDLVNQWYMDTMKCLMVRFLTSYYKY